MIRSLLTCTLLAAMALPALAQPLNSTFTYQGELESNNAPVTGTYDFQFALFDTAAGMIQIGPTVCADNIAVVNGRFTVALDFGAQFNTQQRHLEARVRLDTGLTCATATGFTNLSPRVTLTAAPYASFALASSTATTASSALTANNSGQLSGQPGSFYTSAANLTGTLADAHLSTNVALENTSNTFSSTNTFSATTTLSSIVLSGGSGTIARFSPGAGPLITAGHNNSIIDTKRMWIAHSESLPATGLQYRDVTSDGLVGDSVEFTAGDQTRPLFGFVLPARDFRGYDTAGATMFSLNSGTGAAHFLGNLGVGTNTPDSDLHVMRASAGTVSAHSNAPLVIENSSTCYLQFLTPNVNESGVLFGRVSDNTHGGVIYNSGVNGNGMEFRTNGNAARMYIDASGNVGIGVPPPYSNRLRVLGTTSLGGNLTVQGTGSFTGGIDGASKAFRIDHPLDPTNKELWHTSVESDDMKNLYDGVVTTDPAGYATITLPAWFEALNTSFRYQLTIIDESDSLPELVAAPVVRKVANNQFTIKTTAPNVEVSWQVTGIRKDAYAQKHRTPVEVDKAADVKGRYLHPDSFAAPATQP